MPWPIHEHPASVVSIFTSFIPGFRLVDGEDLLTMGQLLFSAREAVQGGSTQQNATPLETFISQVTEGGSVVLPPGLPGRYLMVVNDTGSALQVYGIHRNVLTGMQDTIAGPSGSAQSIMVEQAAGSMAEYVCYAPGVWKQFGGDGGNIGTGGPKGNIWGSMVWGEGMWDGFPSPTGLPDAPINGVTYGRLNGGWVPILGVSGGTLAGPLILDGSPPTNPNQAVSLSFVQGMNIDEGTY